MAHLPLETTGGIDVISVLPNDLPLAEDRLRNVQSDPQVADRLRSLHAAAANRMLAYVVPVNYIMQGMIANTGPEWMLFQRHQTLAMISDYILNPMGHLQGGPMGHSGPMMHDSPEVKRRVIFVEVTGKRPLASASADFGINDRRTPRFFVDVHLHSKEVLQVQDTPGRTGWGDVPTPMF